MITPPTPLPRPQPRSKRPFDLWFDLCLGENPQHWRLTTLLYAAEQLTSLLEFYGYEMGTDVLVTLIGGRATIKLTVDGSTLEFIA